MVAVALVTVSCCLSVTRLASSLLSVPLRLKSSSSRSPVARSHWRSAVGEWIFESEVTYPDLVNESSIFLVSVYQSSDLIESPENRIEIASQLLAAGQSRNVQNRLRFPLVLLCVVNSPKETEAEFTTEGKLTRSIMSRSPPRKARSPLPGRDALESTRGSGAQEKAWPRGEILSRPKTDGIPGEVICFRDAPGKRR
jgi:hypothetical protein